MLLVQRSIWTDSVVLEGGDASLQYQCLSRRGRSITPKTADSLSPWLAVILQVIHQLSAPGTKPR